MAERPIAGLLVAVALCVGSAAHAAQAPPLADDPALDARVMQIAEELRCLVCQNETIAASQSALAADLRKQIGRMLAEGDSHRQILDYMVSRYGEFVLYNPMLNLRTLVLWLGPFCFLAGALMSLFLGLRQQSRAASTAPMTDAERMHVQALLDDGARMK